MRTEDLHKGVYRRVIDAISRGDPGALDGLVLPDVIDHNPAPDQAPGLEGFKQWISIARTSFPDLQGAIEDLIADGDRIAARVTWRGTQHGPFAGVDATGKPVSFSAFHIVRFADGKVAEWWGTADTLGALQQIGAKVVGPNP